MNLNGRGISRRRAASARRAVFCAESTVNHPIFVERMTEEARYIRKLSTSEMRRVIGHLRQLFS